MNRKKVPWFEVGSKVGEPQVDGGFCRAEIKVTVGLYPEDVYELSEMIHKTVRDFRETIRARGEELEKTSAGGSTGYGG